MSATRILVFAKAPVPGRVKTRLIPMLGPARAARLARSMLGLTLGQALAARVGPVELCASPAPGHPQWTRYPLPPGIETSDQGEGDLGERLGRAVRRALMRDGRALLIGTDCPALTARLLRAAAEALERHDAAMHPALDGGYPLLGLRAYHPSLFADIPWSTRTVATLTLARLQALGWRVWLGEPLPDIDEPADLVHLPDGLRLETWHPSRGDRS